MNHFVARSRSEGVILSLWGLNDGSLLDSFEAGSDEDGNDTSTCLSTCSNLVALATVSGHVFVFDTENAKLSLVFDLKPQGEILGPVRVAKFNSSGKILAVGYDVGAVEVRLLGG